VNERVGGWLLKILSGNGNIQSPLRYRSFVCKAGAAKDYKAAKIDRDTETVVDDSPRIRGWVFMDFFEQPADNGIVELLVECNFRGRKPGEEGWI